MVEKSPNHQTSMSPGTRCVVLVGAGVSAPADLLGGLSRRGVSTVVVSEPAWAMVELARQTTGALVIVQPDRHPWLDELVQAVKTYHPRTVRWAYRSVHHSDRPQLEPLHNGKLEAQVKPTQNKNGRADNSFRHVVPDPQSPLGRAKSQVPRERVRSLVVKVEGLQGIDEPLISEEELAMLLGPAPDEQGGGL